MTSVEVCHVHKQSNVRFFMIGSVREQFTSVNATNLPTIFSKIINANQSMLPSSEKSSKLVSKNACCNALKVHFTAKPTEPIIKISLSELNQ